MRYEHEHDESNSAWSQSAIEARQQDGWELVCIYKISQQHYNYYYYYAWKRLIPEISEDGIR